MEFAAHRVSRLAGQRRDLVVTHFLIGDQQQEQPIFRRQAIQRVLDSLAQLVQLKHAAW